MREEPSTVKKTSKQHTGNMSLQDLQGKVAKGTTTSLNVHGLRDPFTLESGMK